MDWQRNVSCKPYVRTSLANDGAIGAMTVAARVLILRALPYGADSRAVRWGQIYSAFPVSWGCWGSKDSVHQVDNILKHRPSAGYWGFVFGYCKFMWAAFFFAHRRLTAGSTVVCVDLETAIPGMFAARLRGARVHFDVADPFDLAKPVPFKRVFRWLEWWVAKHADVVTVPHASRLDLYGKPLPAAQVVENVPLLPFTQQSRTFLNDANGLTIMTFGYFGTLETHRGLEDIVKLAMENEAVRFKVGGRGVLEPFIRTARASCPRIEFVGEYLPADLPGLTRSVDVYCSLYYSSKKLHCYAAPNKFFEHLALGLPVLMSANTPYAKDVVEGETGWVIEDGYEALQAWFADTHLYKTAFESAGENAQKKWQSSYQNWLTQQKEKLFAFNT